MIDSTDIIAQARKFEGQKYRFGAEIDRQGPNYIGPVDCSELVQHACSRAGLKPSMPDGAYWQWLHTRHLSISIDQAYSTHGALLFIGDGVGTGRDAIVHVGFSLGNGRTFEARGASWPVGEFPRRSTWSFAAKIPGVNHVAPFTQLPAPDPDTLIKEYSIMAHAVTDLAGIIAYVDLAFQRWGRLPNQGLKDRMYWIDKARLAEQPGAVLTELVVTLTANEGERP